MKDNNIPRYMEFRHKLEYYRKEKGLTQDKVVAQLASRDIYVDRSSISHWESGNAEPSIKTLNALASIYGVTVNDFMPGRMMLEEEAPKKNNPSLESILDDFKKMTVKQTTKSAVDYFNSNQDSFANRGIHLITIDLIRDIIGLEAEYNINFGPHQMPVIASRLKKLGYAIQFGGSDFGDSTYFSVALPGGEYAGRKFEDDLANILINMAKSWETPEDEIARKAHELYASYTNGVRSMMEEVTGKDKYGVEFIVSKNSEHEDATSVSNKDELYKLLETVRPDLFWVKNIPGSISWENYDEFKKSFDKNDSIKLHIYWVAMDGKSEVYKEEGFAHNLKDLSAILNSKKQEWFSIMSDGDLLSKSQLLETIKDKIIPSKMIDTFLDTLKKEIDKNE